MDTNTKELIIASLAKYISLLKDSYIESNYINEKELYIKHLAWASYMFSEFYLKESVDRIKELIEIEENNFGNSYLSGGSGVKAEKAFQNFKKEFEKIL